MQLLPLLCAAVLAGQGSLQEARELVRQLGSWRQSAAISALEKFTPEIRQAALLEGLTSTDQAVQSESAFYLGRYRDAMTQKAFETFLPVSQGRGRARAVSYLGRTEYQIPSKILVELFRGDSGLQQAALSAVERQKRAELVTQVGPLLGVSNVNTSNSARRALISVGEPGFREIARQLERGQSTARRGAVAAIPELPSAWRQRLLPIALNDHDPEVLRSALYAFSRGPESGALPLVLRATKSKDNEILGAAITALSYVRDKRASNALLSLTRHPRFGSSAVYALSRQGDSAALPALVKLKDARAHQTLAATVLLYGAESLPYASRLLNEQDMSVRLALVRSITKETLERWTDTGKRRVVELMKGRLYDPSPYVQGAAISALSLLGTEAVLPQVPKTDDLRQLTRAMTWDQTGYAVAALGLAGQKAVPYLLPMLDHYEGAVRARAVAALAIVRDPRTFDRLAEMFGDPDPGVSSAAEKAFVAIGPEGLAPAIAAAAHHWQAIGAVNKMRPKVDDRIGKLLHSKSKDERLGAIRLVGTKDEYHAEITRMLHDRDPDTRCFAALALAVRRDPAAIPVLVEMLPSMPRDRRLEIIGWLGIYPGKHGLAELSELYRSRSWERRYVVAEAIVRRHDVDSLLPLLHDTVSSIREKALFSLGHSNDDRAVLPVRRMVADEVPEVRRSALYAMAELKDVGGFDIVLARLNDSDRDVRWVAASVLGTLGDPRAVPAAHSGRRVEG